MSIQQKIDRELEKIEIEKIKPISDEKMIEVINSLKHIDKDLKMLLDTFIKMMEKIEDQSFKTQMFRRLMKFYGFKNDDILSTRQKFVVIDKKLVKRPFLKQNQKECINILLDELDIIL